VKQVVESCRELNMLDVNNIDFFYGEVQVLTDVSLKVDEGEFVAIFGPNGHGKSTLLKVICGLLRPVSGSVEYDGERVERLPTRHIVNRGLVYVPEDRHLFPEMTVIDNLRMGAFCSNSRPHESENLAYVFHLFPKLERMRKQLALSLSGGEARMLAVGRGLMSNPRFLAIDEPSFGLAPNLRVDVFKAINDIRERGASILLVEQSTGIASDYADRVYVLEDGKIVFEGGSDEALSSEVFRKVCLGI
jgi:branched-chain amino acid transport system ATP-binding protein